METRELLRYLEKLEIGLSSFSYEELGIVEAGELKKSFEIFRSDLEDKVFGTDEITQLHKIYNEIGILASSENNRDLKEHDEHTTNDSEQLLALIKSLEKTNLNTRQFTIVRTLKSMVKNHMDGKETERIGPKPQGTTIESQFSFGKLNLKPALEECLGQMELLEEAIRCYKIHIFEFIGSLKIQMGNESYEDIPASCQKLLPSLRMMRASDLMQIVIQIETTSQTDRDIRYLEFLYDQFLVEFSFVDRVIDRELNALKNM